MIWHCGEVDRWGIAGRRLPFCHLWSCIARSSNVMPSGRGGVPPRSRDCMILWWRIVVVSVIWKMAKLSLRCCSGMARSQEAVRCSRAWQSEDRVRIKEVERLASRGWISRSFRTSFGFRRKSTVARSPILWTVAVLKGMMRGRKRCRSPLKH